MGMQEKGQCRRHHSYKGDSEGDDNKEEDKWKGDDLNVTSRLALVPQGHTLTEY